MEIKKIEKNYLEEIENLEKENFRNEAYNLKTLEEIIEDKNYQFIGLFENDFLIGYIIYRSLDIVEIYKILIKKEHRGKKLSFLLLRDCIDFASKNKLNKIMLEVRNDNIIAKNLYKHENFKEINIRKDYYHNPLCDCLVMEKDINL